MKFFVSTNNICLNFADSDVNYNEKTQQYSLSPFFDQGLCLFADTREDYSLDLPLEQCMEKIEAKPFCTDFYEQLEAAEDLYGTQIRFKFTIKDIQTEIRKAASVYPQEICSRVEALLRIQMRKYAYLLEK